MRKRLPWLWIGAALLALAAPFPCPAQAASAKVRVVTDQWPAMRALEQRLASIERPAGALRAGSAESGIPRAGVDVIYGRDDRREYWDSPPELRRVADAVCVMVDRHELADNGDGTVTLRTYPYAQSFYPPLCDDEAFRDQPTLGSCTAFLVAPDLVVTTGHCLDAGDCGEKAFVFGFAVTDPSQPAPPVLPADNIYYCTEVVARSFHNAPDYSDYSVVRLDRPVIGRDPLPIRPTGAPTVGTRVVMVGYPFGLPLKVSGGAEVKRVRTHFFEANTDSYAGNSGSPVLDSTSLVVQGILEFGQSDYTRDTLANCTRSHVLPDDYGSYEGSILTRDFARFVPDTSAKVKVALTTSQANFDHVDLRWSTSGEWIPGAAVERRDDLMDWKSLADVLPDDRGDFEYQDRGVTPGAMYGYRLTWSDANRVQHSAETWVSIPLHLQFGLAGARPNPARRQDLQVAFTLPESGPARLALYDAGGRRVAERDVGSLGPGDHVVQLDGARSVAAGVYWLHLTQGNQRATRIVILFD